ncbi:hypothetical protein LXL04_001596 [Taraxacum kok-saghyz]
MFLAIEERFEDCIRLNTLHLELSESLNHNLGPNSDIAKDIWMAMFRWLQTSPVNTFHPELFEWVDGWRGSTNRRLVLEAVVCITLWMICRFRNDVVHESRKMRKDMLVDSIKEFSFLWVTNRFKKISINWNLWFFCPLNSLGISLSHSIAILCQIRMWLDLGTSSSLTIQGIKNMKIETKLKKQKTLLKQSRHSKTEQQADQPGFRHQPPDPDPDPTHSLKHPWPPPPWPSKLPETPTNAAPPSGPSPTASPSPLPPPPPPLVPPTVFFFLRFFARLERRLRERKQGHRWEQAEPFRGREVAFRFRCRTERNPLGLLPHCGLVGSGTCGHVGPSVVASEGLLVAGFVARGCRLACHLDAALADLALPLA